jgi:hypothetical protein
VDFCYNNRLVILNDNGTLDKEIPRSLSVPIDVTNLDDRTVAVIEPDGRQGRQILNSDGGLKNPWGIYFDKSKNSLIVVNFSGTCFLYQKC